MYLRDSVAASIQSLISNHGDIGILPNQSNINHNLKQLSVLFLAQPCNSVAERPPFVSTQTGGDSCLRCESIKRCHISFVMSSPPHQPHTLLMFLCGPIGSGVFIKPPPLFFTAPLQLVCNVVTGPIHHGVITFPMILLPVGQ